MAVDITFEGGSNTAPAYEDWTISSTSTSSSSTSSSSNLDVANTALSAGTASGVLDWVGVGLNLFGLGMSLDASDEAAELAKQDAARRAAVSKGQAALTLDQHRKQTKRLISAQRAAYGASGVTQKGSPEDVMKQTRDQAETEAMAILWGGEVGADTAFFEGRISETTAKINQQTTILNSANSIYNILK